MNNIKNILDKYDLKPYKYCYINKASIIYTDSGIYVIKECHFNDDIYNLLLSRKFDYFIYPENDINDNYIIYKYIDEEKIDDDLKAKDLMYVIADLHNRTSSFNKMDLDKIKEIYEDKKNKINYLRDYYNTLEEIFNMHVYNSPAEYLLLRNISKIYNTLDYGNYLIEKWYKNITNNSNIRTCINHNDLSMEHFIDGSNPKLISFDKAKLNYPLYDLVKFYKKQYNDLDMDTLYDIYKHKFKYSLEEELLFFIEIIIPDKIEFTLNNYNDSVNVYKLIRYIDVTRMFILKQQEKDQKRYNHKENE